MITVKQFAPGLITLDFSQEPGFDITEDAIELRSALFIREILDKHIIIEDGGQAGPTLSFIRQALRRAGFKVEFDASIDESLSSFTSERKLIEDIAKRRRRPRPIPSRLTRRLARKLLPHQRTAVGHALAVENAANFSVPGSGKTQVALCAFLAMRDAGSVRRLMVVGPASSFTPWEDEYKFTLGSDPKTVRLIGNRRQRSLRYEEVKDADLVLCTYQMAHRERANLVQCIGRDKYLLVLDESHYVKNIELGPWAATALEMARVAARRMVLSGTPAPHSLKDLWSQFTFLWPSEALLRDRYSFEQSLQSERATESLGKQLAPFFIRIKKSDLKLPRPKTYFIQIPVGSIPPRQRLIIRLLELKTLQQAKDLTLAEQDLATLRNWRRARTLRLLQAASNPALLSASAVDLGEPGPPLGDDPALTKLLRGYLKAELPAKVLWVVQKVREFARRRQKVVVWASYIDNLLLLQHLLKDLRPLLAYGGIPAYERDSDPDFESRERNIREFKTNPKSLVLLANPGACSESISLHTVCQNAVYLERTFNCGKFLQSLDRIHRVGMPAGKTAHYFIPVLSCAIEKTVNARLAERQKLLYEVLNDDMPVLGFREDSFLFDDEDDLESVFDAVLQEITSGAKTSLGKPVRARAHRGAK